MSNKIDELVKKNIESNLSDAILNTISANNEFVADVLDGVRDEQLIIGSTQGAWITILSKIFIILVKKIKKYGIIYSDDILIRILAENVL